MSRMYLLISFSVSSSNLTNQLISHPGNIRLDQKVFFMDTETFVVSESYVVNAITVSNAIGKVGKAN